MNKAYVMGTKRRLDGRKCKLDQWRDKDKCQCEHKKGMHVKKILFGILLHVIVKMENI